jgi:serine/threonine-protein kinase RsbT
MLGAGREILARVSIRDEWDLVVARRRTRELGSRHGLSPSAAEALATAVTEIARNIVVHAGSGEILFGAGDGPEGGVIVTASDTGPGMRIDEAMQDGFSTRGGLGLGLPGARSLVDHFFIESRVGEGTTITLRKWASIR